MVLFNQVFIFIFNKIFSFYFVLKYQYKSMIYTMYISIFQVVHSVWIRNVYYFSLQVIWKVSCLVYIYIFHRNNSGSIQFSIQITTRTILYALYFPTVPRCHSLPFGRKIYKYKYTAFQDMCHRLNGALCKLFTFGIIFNKLVLFLMKP